MLYNVDVLSKLQYVKNIENLFYYEIKTFQALKLIQLRQTSLLKIKFRKLYP